ncbi:type II toxin-antitoxin system HipA family toxin [Glutamicibacter sp. JC586]|uniref:type II toxin-antitoxin system HipA family toxin n=1 Tax=Glutamicibacter sp. JC586 TaxID=2590552 RepID=UPI001358DFF1|nr:type II toxin-antitoxin system HipA family toxin [Glutamicibacter sp. JC586]
MKELLTFLYGQPVGILQQDQSGNRKFRFIPQESGRARLSLTIPYREAPYPRTITDPFIEGLIPEGEGVRQSFADNFGISARNPFALLEHIGLECAGAVQFVRPDEIDEFLDSQGELVPCTDKEIGQRIKALSSSPKGTWTVRRERWSLAGAQSKFALRWQNGWHEATGSEPTTHIFKPGIQDFRDQALNEHLCLKALGLMGLQVAETNFMQFDGQSAIVVKRYDRLFDENNVYRIHQEDFCQATSTLPINKYESSKGPSALKIIMTLRQARAPETEVQKFVEGLIGNYLLGAPDAHAKNYSILHLPDGGIQLAPFYDIASGLPYEHVNADGFPQKKDGLRKAAMSIGSERQFGRVSSKHWSRFAREARIDEEWLRMTVRTMTYALPVALAQVLENESETIGDSELPGKLYPKVEHLCATTQTLLNRDL